MAEINLGELSASKTGQRVDPSVAQDEFEAGSADERTLNNINSSIRSEKKQTPKNSKPKGFLGSVSKVMGQEGKTVIEDSQGVADGSEDGSEGPNEADMDAVEDLEPTPSTPTNSKKRTSDLYQQEHPEQLEGGGEFEGSTHRPAKRSRVSRRAKTPLYSPQAKQPGLVKRQTRATTRQAAKEPEFEKAPGSANQIASKRAENSSEVHQKRSRGRPRKNKEPEKSSDVPERQSEKQVDDAESGENENPRHGPPSRQELREREAARRAEASKAWEAGRLERERKREAEAQRELEGKQRQRNEIYRKQQEIMDAKLNDPIHGRHLRAEMEWAEERKAKLLGLSSSQSRLYRSSHMSAVQQLEDDEDDPFAEHQAQAARSFQSHPGRSSQAAHAKQLEDVYRDEDVADEPLTDITANCREDGSIAGTPNVKRNRRPNLKEKPSLIPLSKEDMTTFLEVMRKNIHKDQKLRYQFAAARLGRPTHEIIKIGKEFQRYMDNEHKNGRFQEEFDQWTNDVWVEHV